MIQTDWTLAVSSVLASSVASADSSGVTLVFGLMLFAVAGTLFILGALTFGSLVRPKLAHPVKAEPYECGEMAVGESWVQFDLRFYTVALIFIVFDVEIALLWPWAVAFKDMGGAASWPFLVFFLLIAIPFLYEWKSGYLNWVRDSSAQDSGAKLKKNPFPPLENPS